MRVAVLLILLIGLSKVLHSQPFDGRPNTLLLLINKKENTKIKSFSVYIDRSAKVKTGKLPDRQFLKNFIIVKEQKFLHPFNYSIVKDSAIAYPESASILHNQKPGNSFILMFSTYNRKCYVIFDARLFTEKGSEQNVYCLENLPFVSGVYFIDSAYGRQNLQLTGRISPKKVLPGYNVVNITPVNWNLCKIEADVNNPLSVIEHLICINFNWLVKFEYFDPNKILGAYTSFRSYFLQEYEQFKSRWEMVIKEHNGHLPANLLNELNYQSANNIERFYQYPYARAIAILLRNSAGNTAEIESMVKRNNGIITEELLDDFFKSRGIGIVVFKKEWDEYRTKVEMLKEKCISKKLN
jgi:hypothetical protein